MNGRWSGWCSLALVAFHVAGCSLLPGGEPTLDSALRARQLMVPVAGVAPDQVPDNFRSPRSGAHIHGAVDIPAPRGTPVLSADDGRVLRLQRNRKGGLTIYATDESEHLDRKSTRLNSSHRTISYAVFCLKKKKTQMNNH